jgi:hypothetical protein
MSSGAQQNCRLQAAKTQLSTRPNLSQRQYVLQMAGSLSDKKWNGVCFAGRELAYHFAIKEDAEAFSEHCQNAIQLESLRLL